MYGDFKKILNSDPSLRCISSQEFLKLVRSGSTVFVDVIIKKFSNEFKHQNKNLLK